MNVYDAQGKSIWLDESVGRGGEATVYRVRGQTGWLAKIYEPGPRPNYSAKLTWMVDHPPENPTRSIAHSSLAWPFSLLYDSKHKLVGYLMPHIHAAVPLLEVFNPRRRLATLPRFDRRYLHRTARNLSATLAALHARGYVVGDLNESNVLVTPAALVTLIDTDSFQVPEARGKKIVVHPCPVGKLEYTPPELHNQAIGSVVRQSEHDAFALGVLIFQLLMEGNHPFRACWLGNGDPPPIETRIAQGVFPYASLTQTMVRPPKGAPDLNQLHPSLVELVFRCFADGHNDPQQRPDAGQWERALVQAEKALVQCPNRHLYSSHLTKCPHCQAADRKAGGQARAVPPKRGESWRAPKDTGHQAAANSPKAGTTRAARQKPPKAKPQPAYRTPRTAPSIPVIIWQAFIAPRVNIPWVQPAYPFGTPSQPGPPNPPPSSPRPANPPPSSHHPVYQSWSGGANLRGNLWAWSRPRLSKSLAIGGGLGALIGALIGALAGIASASLGEMAALTLLWALGGAAAGVLRGWKPGYQMSVWVNRHLGWHRVLPILGLLAGALIGMLIGLLIGWWAILPVFFGLFLGAYLGKQAGRMFVVLGNRLGWERMWAGLSAGSTALFGWLVATWLGGGAVGLFAAQGAASLAGWLAGSTPGVLLTAGVSGALCGGLAGAISGSIADLVARFSGLID